MQSKLITFRFIHMITSWHYLRGVTEIKRIAIFDMLYTQLECNRQPLKKMLDENREIDCQNPGPSSIELNTKYVTSISCVSSQWSQGVAGLGSPFRVSSGGAVWQQRCLHSCWYLSHLDRSSASLPPQTCSTFCLPASTTHGPTLPSPRAHTHTKPLPRHFFDVARWRGALMWRMVYVPRDNGWE